MYCYNCGSKIADDDKYCIFCGTLMPNYHKAKSKSKVYKFILFCGVILICCITVFIFIKTKQDERTTANNTEKNLSTTSVIANDNVLSNKVANNKPSIKVVDDPLTRNPIINSPNDITNQLVLRIAFNELDSLTINYEFTQCDNDISFVIDDKIVEKKLKTNPFFRANHQVKKLESINFKVILTPKVKSLACAFAYLDELRYVNLTDVSNITNMRGTFYKARKFNQNISNWDTSNVTDMSHMFESASSFNKPIGNWNISNVTNIKNMFASAFNFNQPIGNWDTSKVTTMKKTFMAAYSFNQPIGNWNTSNVTDISSMFWKDRKSVV